jgi:PAS domain S-box-containing protein
VRGTINFYSNEIDFFNRDEIQLLDEMAMDVSFALDFIEREEERKKAVENLRESEAKFSAAFAFSPSALVIYSITNQIFLDVNIGFLQMTGYKREEVIGQSCVQLNLPFITANSHLYKRLLDGGENSVAFEDRYVNKSGELRYFLASASIINVGIEPCIMTQMIDITDRKKFEDALKDSEEKYRKLAQTASDSIITIDKDGLIISWNEAAEKTFGYSSNEVIGKEMQLILPPKHRQTHTIAFDELKAGREPRILGRTTTIEAMRKNGNKFPIELSLSSWNTKNSVFYTAIIRDISERAKAELELETYRNHLEELVKLRTLELNKANEALRRKIEKDEEMEMMLQQSLQKEKELNEMKSKFISTISHEFRTPLTTIFSSTELIQVYGERWTLEKRNELFDRIKKAVNYLTRLLDDVLTIGRTETGKISFQPEEVQLKDFALECLQDVRPLMSGKHKARFNYDTTQSSFSLDPKLLRFILNNLLSNAIKYSPDGGKVELKIFDVRDQLVIEVRDEGIGIPSEEIEKIFQAFYRTKNTGIIAGTGLGLAIVERAVLLHNGKIAVQSEINKGTTFTISIPLRQS